MATVEQIWVEQHKDAWVREGIEKGIERGAAQTLQQSVIEVLNARFGFVPSEVSQQIEQMSDAARLQQLHRQAVTIDSIEAFVKLLK